MWFIEATGDGVYWRNWESDVKPEWGIKQLIGTDFSKIVYRRLKVERTDELRDLMDDFVAEVEGRPYSLSVKDMLMRRETTDRASVIQQNRGFFCSELVAKAYKYMKIMEPTNDACSNFKPVHFS